jgi:cytochrome oxidase Cu insertion factor (SCO1/SenC/PrrC family)
MSASHLGAPVAESCDAVEQVQVRVGELERLVLVLTVEVDPRRDPLPQRSRGHEDIVD